MIRPLKDETNFHFNWKLKKCSQNNKK
jgi:hypothetical protein